MITSTPSFRRRRKKMSNNMVSGKRIRKNIIILYASLFIFIGCIFCYYFSLSTTITTTENNLLLRGSNNKKKSLPWIDASSSTLPFDQDHVASSATNLVMVAGHSVIVSGNLEDAGTDESVWWLIDYQRNRGMPQAILGHIRAGIEEAAADPKSLLIYSGGQTRSLTGPLSEGASYFLVSDAMKLWPLGSTVRSRTVVEEYATDSFENLLFSICRFFEITGRYPEKITAVSFTFKQHRFETLHAPTIHYNNKFKFVGYNPPLSTGFNLQESTQGENENAAKPFETDPYGCYSTFLQEKRKGRNPFHRTAPYSQTCPDMSALLNYCGPEIIRKEMVPWTTTS